MLAADRGEFEIALSVPLLAEYDDVIHRANSGIAIPADAASSVIGWIAAIAHKQPIYYLWRPLLSDPKDEMVLELAVAANAGYIVTFNIKDFLPAAQFGIEVITPSLFYRKIL